MRKLIGNCNFKKQSYHYTLRDETWFAIPTTASLLNIPFSCYYWTPFFMFLLFFKTGNLPSFLLFLRTRLQTNHTTCNKIKISSPSYLAIPFSVFLELYGNPKLRLIYIRLATLWTRVTCSHFSRQLDQYPRPFPFRRAEKRCRLAALFQESRRKKVVSILCPFALLLKS